VLSLNLLLYFCYHTVRKLLLLPGIRITILFCLMSQKIKLNFP